MKRIFQYILFAMTLSVMAFVLHGCKDDGVIDEDDMAEIYAEMLITDQWISTKPGLRKTADTSFVYEPILKKYGYTSADYRRSVEYYLNDPDDYAEIMKTTVKLLEKRLKSLQLKREGIDEEKLLERRIKELAKEIDFPSAALYLSLLENEMFGNPDSLSVVWDSLARCYTIHPVERKLLKESSDSLQVADSIPQLDSLAVRDSLKALDTMPKLDTIPKLDTMPKLDTTRKPIKPAELRPKNVRPLGTVKPSHKMIVTDTLARI